MDSGVLALISGMPGTGKTALARRIVRALHIPVFAKDRIQSALRMRGLTGRATADGYHLMFDLADEQLSLGLGVVLDAVFPLAEFRLVARDIARRHRVRFRPIYCYCSDESVWRERVGGRRQFVPNWTPVGWAEVERLREIYEPWEPETALFLDALNPVQENLALALGWIQEEGGRRDA
jgi:predicted kinase